MLEQFQWFLKKLQKLEQTVLRNHKIRSSPKRYKHLFEIVDRCKARRIMEIGTWKGEHSVKMINTTKKHWLPEEIEYYGFDLFENINEETIIAEVSKKPPSMNEVKQKLEKTGAKIKLYRGNTLHTLPEAVKNLPKMDFIFIDGGHSIETIQNDWEYSKRLIHNQTVVIFDDYWNTENSENSGCNKTIDSIDRNKFSVEILQPMDKFEKGRGVLCINFVKVMERTKTKERL